MKTINKKLVINTIGELRDLQHEINMIVAKEPTTELSMKAITDEFYTEKIDSFEKVIIRDDEVLVRAIKGIYVVSKIHKDYPTI